VVACRHEAEIPDHDPDGEYGTNPVDLVEQGDGSCWTSKAVAPGWTSRFDVFDSGVLHLPVLDVDIPLWVDPVKFTNRAREVLHDVFWEAKQYWVPSTTNNHYHVYIGAAPGEIAYGAMKWSDYEERLRFLSSQQLVDSGWVYHSIKKELAVVRKPGYVKPVKVPTNYCMWCGGEFPVTGLDEHEDACGA
jgi:hypothetical protein